MKQSALPQDHHLLSCEVCLTSIPSSEADSSEAEDYIVYYYGLECYETWANQQDNEQAQEDCKKNKK